MAISKTGIGEIKIGGLRDLCPGTTRDPPIDLIGNDVTATVRDGLGPAQADGGIARLGDEVKWGVGDCCWYCAAGYASDLGALTIDREYLVIIALSVGEASIHITQSGGDGD